MNRLTLKQVLAAIEELRASEASALAQELIDHCLNPDSNKSPEVLEKVKSVLKIDSQNSQRQQENQEEGSTKSSHKQSRGKHNKEGKKTKKSQPNITEPSSSGGKKKQMTLSFESTKPTSKRKVISPNKNEHPDKREKKDSDIEAASTSITHSVSRNVTVGQKILSMISPQKYGVEQCINIVCITLYNKMCHFIFNYEL